MNPNEVSRKLLSALTGVPVSGIPANASISNFPDWDSVVHMELIVQIEERLSRELTGDEMSSLSTLEGVARLLGETEHRGQP